MRRKLLLILLGIVVMNVVARAVGAVMSKKLTEGNEDSDEFQIAAICGPKTFRSHAAHLRTGTAITSMGGIDLDLREATLDPAGAELELKATMGGVQVFVPDDWVVEVDEEVVAGGFQVNVTPKEALPDDAPRLHIHAVGRLGGGVVTTTAA